MSFDLGNLFPEDESEWWPTTLDWFLLGDDDWLFPNESDDWLVMETELDLYWFGFDTE
jgi:hypothetical protein